MEGKKSKDFTKNVIYKIICRDKSITDLYIGSTIDFNNRKHVHKNDSKKKLHLPLYITINKNGGWENWEMIEIESYPCNTLQEARVREKYWFIELNATLTLSASSLTV